MIKQPRHDRREGEKMLRTIPAAARSGINPIRDKPATQHRIILQPNRDSLHHGLTCVGVAAIPNSE